MVDRQPAAWWRGRESQATNSFKAIHTLVPSRTYVDYNGKVKLAIQRRRWEGDGGPWWAVKLGGPQVRNPSLDTTANAGGVGKGGWRKGECPFRRVRVGRASQSNHNRRSIRSPLPPPLLTSRRKPPRLGGNGLFACRNFKVNIFIQWTLALTFNGEICWSFEEEEKGREGGRRRNSLSWRDGRGMEEKWTDETENTNKKRSGARSFRNAVPTL